MLLLRVVWAVVRALVSKKGSFHVDGSIRLWTKESSFPRRFRPGTRFLIPVHPRMNDELVVATRPIGLVRSCQQKGKGAVFASSRCAAEIMEVATAGVYTSSL